MASVEGANRTVVFVHLYFVHFILCMSYVTCSFVPLLTMHLSVCSCASIYLHDVHLYGVHVSSGYVHQFSYSYICSLCICAFIRCTLVIVHVLLLLNF